MAQALGPAEDVPPSLRVCGQNVQCVEEFTYLGVLIHSSCSSDFLSSRHSSWFRPLIACITNSRAVIVIDCVVAALASNVDSTEV